jgi:hypothetical protein
MKRALKVTPEFEVEVLDIEDNFLEIVQGAVEGLIQPVDYNNRLTFWVNEEFYSLTDPKPNLVATTFYNILGSEHTIMGNAVFTGGTDNEGDVQALDDETYETLLEVIAEAKVEMGGM